LEGHLPGSELARVRAEMVSLFRVSHRFFDVQVVIDAGNIISVFVNVRGRFRFASKNVKICRNTGMGCLGKLEKLLDSFHFVK
jgi:hypothetical protein